MNEQLIYQIALTSIPNIGDRTAKKLIAYCGSAKDVFEESKKALEKIPSIGIVNAQKIYSYKNEALNIAEKELTFIDKNKIDAHFYLDDNYPNKLKHCEDGPIVLYTKGKINFNEHKAISIVGTRKATDYGKDFCDQLIKDLKPHYPLIISGLAYGIDVCSHKAALKNNIPTIGVLAHGLDRVYPSQHKSVAAQMLENGGLVTEFKSRTNPDRENFPKRNRIVAGIVDLTVVIESSKKGGSLITAELANNYNRDVFALPGKISDTQSEGCNWLIKTNKAALLQSVKDIEYIMGWEVRKEEQKQVNLFEILTPEQQAIVEVLNIKGKATVDDIALQTKFPMSKTTSLLLDLEFTGKIKSLPGKVYKIA